MFSIIEKVTGETFFFSTGPLQNANSQNIKLTRTVIKHPAK
jgi:hypothetical protein